MSYVLRKLCSRAALRCLSMIGLGACLPLHEALADLMLNPTRIVFEKNTRAAQMDLINNGGETATYRISVINRRMNEIGQFTNVESPEPGELFAEPMLRYSPRQVTLPPGGGQTVRILLRKPENLAPGEYRSHLMFQRVAEGQDKAPEVASADTQSTDVSISLRALVSVSVPVIVRHGDTTVIAEFGELAVQKSPTGQPLLAFELLRKGTRSVYGDLLVTFARAGAAPVTVGRINGVAVYTPNPTRTAQLALQPPPGSELSRGVLRVVYRERPQDGGKLLAERTLQLP